MTQHVDLWDSLGQHHPAQFGCCTSTFASPQSQSEHVKFKCLPGAFLGDGQAALMSCSASLTRDRVTVHLAATCIQISALQAHESEKKALQIALFVHLLGRRHEGLL